MSEVFSVTGNNLLSAIPKGKAHTPFAPTFGFCMAISRPHSIARCHYSMGDVHIAIKKEDQAGAELCQAKVKLC